MTPKVTHAEWQKQVTELAKRLGWTVLSVRRTIGSEGRWVTGTNIAGWPDLLCFAPARGFVALELKVGKDKPRPNQLAILATLEAAGARTMVAYPADIDAVANLLRYRRLPIETTAPPRVPLPIPTTQGDNP